VIDILVETIYSVFVESGGSSSSKADGSGNSKFAKTPAAVNLKFTETPKQANSPFSRSKEIEELRVHRKLMVW